MSRNVLVRGKFCANGFGKVKVAFSQYGTIGALNLELFCM